jgi:hypothetical protein
LQGDRGVHHKSHVGHIYGYTTNPGKKFLIDAKRKSALIELFIGIGRPIQGQGKTRTASAAWGEINADAPAFLIRKVRFKLFTGAFTQIKHEKPPLGYCRVSPQHATDIRCVPAFVNAVCPGVS